MVGNRPRHECLRSVCSAASLGLFLLSILAVLWAPGCRDETVLPIDRNAAPETILTQAPGDSQTSLYRVHLYWLGTDPDGEVTAYEWAITESLPTNVSLIEYSRTELTDSVFTFQVELNREVLGHRFYVRAIDNEGKRDPEPAWTFFAARNNSEPRVSFVRAEAIGPLGERMAITSDSRGVPTDTVPTGWSVAFSWRGYDGDVMLLPDGTIDTIGFVSHYSHHLTPLEVTEIDGDLADTTAAYGTESLRSDTYTLYVRAIDDAGFAGLDPAVRSFVWNKDPVTRFAPVPRALGSADSMRGFWADTTAGGGDDFVPIAAGDTMRITTGGVRVRAEVRGYDPDPADGDGSVIAYNARLIRDSNVWESLDESRVFLKQGVLSGDQFLMCRSLDRLGRWDGSPDTIRVAVNLPARYRTFRDFGEGQVFHQRPMEGAVLRVPSTQDTLIIAFHAVDPDPAGSPGLEFQYKFERYPIAGGGTAQDANFWPTDWARPTRLWWVFAATHGNQSPLPFLPGDYTLLVQCRDRRTVGDDAGIRISQRRVHFRIEAPSAPRP